MYQSKNINSELIDSKGVRKGVVAVTVYFEADGPLFIEHKGKNYLFTGKRGTDSDTGEAVRELANDNGARLWITLDGQMIWQD